MSNLELVLLGITAGIPVGIVIDRFVIHPLVDFQMMLRRGGRGPKR